MFENVVGVQMPKRPKTRALERFLTTDPSLLTRLLEAIGPSAIKIYAHFKQEVASAVISNCASTRWDHRDIEALLQGYQPAFVECGLFVEFHRQDLGCDDGSDFFFFLEVSDIRRGFGRVEMQLPAVRRSELLTRPTPPKLAALLQARDATKIYESWREATAEECAGGFHHVWRADRVEDVVTRCQVDFEACGVRLEYIHRSGRAEEGPPCWSRRGRHYLQFTDERGEGPAKGVRVGGLT